MSSKTITAFHLQNDSSISLEWWLQQKTGIILIISYPNSTITMFHWNEAIGPLKIKMSKIRLSFFWFLVNPQSSSLYTFSCLITGIWFVNPKLWIRTFWQLGLTYDIRNQNSPCSHFHFTRKKYKVVWAYYVRWM